ncbi:Hypp8541 [Branchiostoma lanceolatum]|uniref:Hypp8541 protein n=1 Tax=Branchiostoma lanceolatum TaxID=7740 RepID=A0A8J9Z7A5_BRALA|nr:Hypp8541 [Branchiostoma lanceolatum]
MSSETKAAKKPAQAPPAKETETVAEEPPTDKPKDGSEPSNEGLTRQHSSKAQPPTTSKTMMSSHVRHKGPTKGRGQYGDDSFDLDLTYITERIIVDWYRKRVGGKTCPVWTGLGSGKTCPPSLQTGQVFLLSGLDSFSTNPLQQKDLTLIEF